MTYPNLSNVYDEMQIDAVVKLATLGEPFIPNLIDALADIDSMVLCGAAQILVRLGQGAAPWLMDALEQHPRYQVRARVFVKRLKTPCPDTLMAAGTAFFEIGPTGVVTVLPALEKFLTKVEASMRKSAELAKNPINGKPQVNKASKRTDTNHTGPQTGV